MCCIKSTHSKKCCVRTKAAMVSSIPLRVSLRPFLLMFRKNTKKSIPSLWFPKTLTWRSVLEKNVKVLFGQSETIPWSAKSAKDHSAQIASWPHTKENAILMKSSSLRTTCTIVNVRNASLLLKKTKVATTWLANAAISSAMSVEINGQASTTTITMPMDALSSTEMNLTMTIATATVDVSMNVSAKPWDSSSNYQ